jgi:chromosome segregation ATPase
VQDSLTDLLQAVEHAQQEKKELILQLERLRGENSALRADLEGRKRELEEEVVRHGESHKVKLARIAQLRDEILDVNAALEAMQAEVASLKDELRQKETFVERIQRYRESSVKYREQADELRKKFADYRDSAEQRDRHFQGQVKRLEGRLHDLGSEAFDQVEELDERHSADKQERERLQTLLDHRNKTIRKQREEIDKLEGLLAEGDEEISRLKMSMSSLQHDNSFLAQRSDEFQAMLSDDELRTVGEELGREVARLSAENHKKAGTITALQQRLRESANFSQAKLEAQRTQAYEGRVNLERRLGLLEQQRRDDQTTIFQLREQLQEAQEIAAKTQQALKDHSARALAQ